MTSVEAAGVRRFEDASHVMPAREERASDSPHVEMIARFRVEEDCSHVCPADHAWNMLVVRYKGNTSLSLCGPETQPTLMSQPKGAEFLCISFKLGRFLPHLPIGNRANTLTVLPDASSQTFWLDSASWQFPDFENADTFVERLARAGLLVHDPVVDEVLSGNPQDLPARTVRYRFLRATGLTPGYVRQLERARQAVRLLEQGMSILDVVEQAGYADQPHLTRSLRRFIGRTPAHIARPGLPG